MALEELSRPLSVIDALFEQSLTANGGMPAPEFGERTHFQKVLGLDNEEALAKIPCLNDVESADSVPPFSLVRYRCLVQDVFEPEFYGGVFQEVDAGGATRFRTTKFRECIEPTPGRQLRELDDHAGLLQRGACYCVPMPGERSWAQSAAKEWTSAGGGSINPSQSRATPSTSAAQKRGRDDDVSMEPQDEVVQPPATRVTTGQEKNPQAQTAVSQVCGLCTTSTSTLKTAEDFGLNFPIPSEERRGHGASTACIVKLYDADSEALKLCDSIEVIGILCVNPDIATLPDGSTGNMEEEWRDARHPPTSLVPRLHALAVRQLPFHHPLLPFTASFLSEERLAAAFQRQFSAPGAMLSARTAALEQLGRCLGSDVLSAEYLLMILVARSFSKHGEKLLGSLSLNFAVGRNGLDTKAISDAAGELVPRAVHVDLTIDNLNGQKWRPKKDFVADRLVAGQLQLAAGTLLIVDEMKMAQGNLTAEGHKSLLSLQQLVTENKLACDFMSYDVNIPVEVSCVLVSERKSVVKDIEVLVPMRVAPSAAQGAMGSMAPQALGAARWLIALVTRSTRPLRIPDDVMRVFGENFASVRQEFKVTPELAHTWMALARARCLIFGEEELSMQRWQEVMELERTRLLRCREDGLLAI